MKFIGRIQELQLLRQEFARPRPSFVVVYGRRRVGKSTLILESLKHQPHIYFQATRLTDADNMGLFKQTLSQFFAQSELLNHQSNWSGVFAYLEVQAQKRPNLTIVLDEFPYLCEAQPALPSIVQAAWDRIRHNQAQLNLLLCGSSIAFMENLLAEKNPLRGRQTQTINLQPLDYREITPWVRKWSLPDQLFAYAVFGGMPYYWSLLTPQNGIESNILELILQRGAPLFDEVNLMLQAELQSPQRYASVLHAIAQGCRSWGEIIGRVKEFKDAAQLAPYIQKLEALRLVQSTRSFDASPKDRNTRYEIAEPFLEFWFRFVLPHQSALESGYAQAILQQKILPYKNEYMGKMFERICLAYMRFHSQEIFGQICLRVGQIWAADYDLDVVAELLDGSRVFGECKWWADPVGENVYLHLLETVSKSQNISQNPQYVLFSKSGFTTGLKRIAKQMANLHLLDLSALLGRRRKVKNSAP